MAKIAAILGDLRSNRDRLVKDLYFYSIFAILIAVLYHPVMNNFWVFDDTYILRQIQKNSILNFFLVPAVWHKISTSYLTPWVTLSLGLDLKIFGFHHQFFYLHQLFSIWLAVIALYAILKSYMPRVFGAAGALLFLFSAPIAAAAEMLSIRHYIEGLVLYLFALYFFIKALRNHALFNSLLSAVLYFFAMSAKELYVPLGMVFLFFPRGGLKKRIACSIPSIGALILYFIWRQWMLGSFIAGPGMGLFISYSGWNSLLFFIKNVYVSLLMFSGGTVGNTILIFCVCMLPAAAVILCLKERKYLPLLFFTILFFAVYSVPLSVFNLYDVKSVFTEYRLSLVIAAYLSVVIPSAAYFLYDYIGHGNLTTTRFGSISKGLPLSLLAGILMITVWSSTLWIAAQRERIIKPLVQEAKFFMRAGKDILIVTPKPIPSYYYENLEFFKWYYLKEQSPGVVYNSFAYPDDPEPPALKGLSIFRYDVDRGAMSDITGFFFRKRSEYLSHVKKMPFSVTLTVNKGEVSFFVGPSSAGQYFALMGYRPGLYCATATVVRQARVKMATSIKAFLRFGWESPEGWITFSPEWFIDSSKNQEIVWSQ